MMSLILGCEASPSADGDSSAFAVMTAMAAAVATIPMRTVFMLFSRAGNFLLVRRPQLLAALLGKGRLTSLVQRRARIDRRQRRLDGLDPIARRPRKAFIG